MNLFNAIKKVCPSGKLEKNVELKTLSTIKIGGRADYLVCPGSVQELIDLVDLLQRHHKKYYVLGNGSNVLCKDGRYHGVIIKLSLLSKIVRHKNFVYAEAGVHLAMLVGFARLEGLAGLEDAIGIPGTVGGAVVMNASAYNFETKKVLRGVHVLREGKIVYLRARDCNFGYRDSGLKNDIVVSADFKLVPGDPVRLSLRQIEILKLRQRLPVLPSLGSVFKRQGEVAVSRVLDEIGLKGAKRGGAMVSREHAGIIVNFKNARAKDVKKLIKYIKKRCFYEKNIILEEEIKFLR